VAHPRHQLLDPATAQSLADDAHQVCPDSNATRGNIDVGPTVVRLALTLGAFRVGLVRIDDVVRYGPMLDGVRNGSVPVVRRPVATSGMCRLWGQGGGAARWTSVNGSRAPWRLEMTYRVPLLATPAVNGWLSSRG